MAKIKLHHSICVEKRSRDYPVSDWLKDTKNLNVIFLKSPESTKYENIAKLLLVHFNVRFVPDIVEDLQAIIFFPASSLGILLASEKCYYVPVHSYIRF